MNLVMWIWHGWKHTVIILAITNGDKEVWHVLVAISPRHTELW